MIKSKIESLLFISIKPLSIKQLSKITEKKNKEIELELNKLIDEYKNNSHGIQIIKNESKYQMVSSPENAKLIKKLIKDETTGELTRPSLETLTIIAYRQPISKIDIERIRGINCSLIIKNLLTRGLIEFKYNKIKDETYYNITFDFIRFLGINNITELPDYKKLSKDDSIDKMLSETEK